MGVQVGVAGAGVEVIERRRHQPGDIDLRNGTVTETTTDDPPVMIQPCVTAAAGPCTIEQKDS